MRRHLLPAILALITALAVLLAGVIVASPAAAAPQQVLVTITVEPGVSERIFGTDLTVEVTVTAPDEGPQPVGAVTLSDGDTELTPTLGVSGGTAASRVLSGLDAGEHLLTAAFVPTDDEAFEAGSGQLSVVVLRAAQEIDLGDLDLDVAPTETWTLPTGSPLPYEMSIDPGTDEEVCEAVETELRFLAAGACSITVTAAGDENHLDADEVGVTFTVAGRATDTTLAATPVSPSVGEEITLTATVAAVESGHGTPAGQVRFDLGPTTLATVPLSGGVATHPFTPADATPRTYTATYLPATARFLDSSDALELSASRLPQEIGFAEDSPTEALALEEWDVEVEGGGSEQPVELSVHEDAEEICSVEGTTVSFDAAGTCEILANQAGDDSHEAAPEAGHQVEVGRRPLDIEVVAVPSSTTYGNDVEVTATVTDRTTGTPVPGTGTISIPGVSDAAATWSNGVGRRTFVDLIAQTHTIEVDYTPTAGQIYDGASDVGQVTVGLAPQTIVLSAAPVRPRVGSTWTPTASGGDSGQPVQLAVSSESTAGACSVAGGTVSFAQVGECTIVATQAGVAGRYAPATPVSSATITVDPREVTLQITQTPAGPISFGPTAAVTVTVTATDTATGAAVPGGGTITAEMEGGATNWTGGIGTRTFTPEGAGTFEVSVSYVPTSTSTHESKTGTASITVVPGAQTVTVSEAPETSRVGETWTPTTTGGPSGNPVVLSVAAGSLAVCSTDGSTVTFDAEGECSILANQAGVADQYLAAPTVVSGPIAVTRRQVSVVIDRTPSGTVPFGTPVTVTATATESGTSTRVNGAGTLTVGGVPDEAVTWVNGQATRTFPAPAAGDHAIEADFTPTNEVRYLPQTASGTLTTAAAPQAIVVSTPPTLPYVGEEWTPELSGGGSGNPVLLRVAETSTADACAISSPGVVRFTGAGECRIVADQEGVAGQYQPGTQTVPAITVRRRPVDVAMLQQPAGEVEYSNAVTVTITVTDRGNPVPGSGVVTVNGVTQSGVAWHDNVGLMTFEPPSSGDYVVAVDFAPTDSVSYEPGAGQLTTTIVEAAQTITLEEAPGPQYVDDEWTPSKAGGASGNEVVLSSGSINVCTVSGDTVHFVAAGDCIVHADQLGDPGKYQAAPRVSRIVLVRRIPVELSLTVPSGARVGDWIVVQATARDDGAPLLGGTGIVGIDEVGSSTSPASWLIGIGSYGTTITRAGTFTARVSYTPANEVKYEPGILTRTIIIGAGQQSIVIGNPSPASGFVGGSWLPEASVPTSGLAVDLLVPDTQDVCAPEDGFRIVFLDAGECTVVLSRPATADYDAAPDRTVHITVERVPVTVELRHSANRRVDRLYTLTAVATADGEAVPGTFDLEIGDLLPHLTGVHSATGQASRQLTPTRAQTHALLVRFVPDDAVRFATPDPATGSVTFIKGSQTITLTHESVGTVRVGGSWTPMPTASSGVPVAMSVTSSGGACAEREGQPGTVDFVDAGVCRVDFAAPATDDHDAALPVSRTVQIQLHPTTVAVQPLSQKYVADEFDLSARVIDSAEMDVVVEGTVRFEIGGEPVGEPAVVDPVTGLATTRVTRMSAGSVTVRAIFTPTEANHWAGSEHSGSLSVVRKPQSIDIRVLPPATPQGVLERWTPQAVTRSGTDSSTTSLTVRLTVLEESEDNCEVAPDGDAIVFTGAGRCEVTFDQPGDHEYLPATQVTAYADVVRNHTVPTISVADDARVGEWTTVTAIAKRIDRDAEVEGTFVYRVLSGDEEIPHEVVGAQVPGSTGNTGATIRLRPAHAGTYQVSVEFTPEDEIAFFSSAGGPTDLEVHRAPTSTTLEVGPDLAVARVSAQVPEAGVPTGTVVFRADGETLGSPVELSGGQATLQHGIDPALKVTVRAEYVGTADFEPSGREVLRDLPTITAAVTASQPARDGWYRVPVTVRFTCTPKGAPLVGGCPSPVVLTANGADQRVTGTVEAADGGWARTQVGGINIDRTAPTVRVTGTQRGAWYRGVAPASRCTGSDPLSGLASCTVSTRAVNKRVRVATATAVDRAGNTSTQRIRFQVRQEWVLGAKLVGNSFRVRRGSTQRVIVRTNGAKPSLLVPRRPGGPPRVAGPRFVAVTLQNGVVTWVARVRVPRQVRPGRIHRLAVTFAKAPRRPIRLAVVRR